jgi:hypothetical protein
VSMVCVCSAGKHIEWRISMEEHVGFGSSEAGKKGAAARAKRLTPEERSAIARKAAEERWVREGREPVPVATHGSPDHPLRIGGDIEIPCYVLSDGRRVLVQRGMLTAMDMSQGTAGRGGGDRIAKFIASKSIYPYVPKGLSDVIIEPIRFRTPAGNDAYGYEATVLADLCDAVLDARKCGKLNYQQEHIAARCEILVRGFARVGIVALVDEATGYQADRARDALAKILERFVAKELQRWVKTFPADYYRELFRLWGLAFDPTKFKKPGVVGTLTNNIVYARLAPGVLDELKRKNPRNESGNRTAKHHQHLTKDLGHPRLLEHLSAVIALMRVSATKDQFMALLDKALPKWGDAPLFMPQTDDQQPRMSHALP